MTTPVSPEMPPVPPLRFGARRPLCVRPVFPPQLVPATANAAASALPPALPQPVACVVPGFASSALCTAMVDACAESAWSMPSYQFGTTDLEVDEHPRVRAVLRDAEFVPAVSDAMTRAFGFRPSGFDDLFIVRYDAARGQKELQMHQDGGDISFMLALSERSAYKGGGTRFAALGPDAPPLHLDQGDLVLFDASRFHEGMQISRGIRMLLVGFSYVGRAPGPGHLNTQLQRVTRPTASAGCANKRSHAGMCTKPSKRKRQLKMKKKEKKKKKSDTAHKRQRKVDPATTMHRASLDQTFSY